MDSAHGKSSLEKLYMPPVKKVHYAFFFIVIAAWVAFAVHFIQQTSHISTDGIRYFMLFDDGMISMRYAKNLVAHHQLVWNLGDRIEGFTNPLWTFLMAISIWLCGTHYAPLAIQVLGALICLGLFFLFFKQTRNSGSSFLAFACGLSLLVCSYPISYWALGGMESIATGFLFATVLFTQFFYENRRRENPVVLQAILMALAYCMRPDGWLAIAPFFAACVLDAVKAKEYRRALRAVLIVSAVVTAVLCARILYYGEWTPNTYVLKIEGYGLALRLRNGLSFVSRFSNENYGLLALIVLAALSAKRVALLNLGSAVIVLAYQIYAGGDPWFYWRQLLPVYVLASFSVLVLFECINKWVASTSEQTAPSSVQQGIVLVILFGPVLLGSYLFFFTGSVWIFAAILNCSILGTLLACIALRWEAKFPKLKDRIWSLKLVASSLVLLITVFSIVVGNRRFLQELSTKPGEFRNQAKMVDKAVLAMKLFGPGRVHHVFYAGTYAYYVEGTVIDALGKSDRKVARYPVDQTVAWNGILGVPGHAKHNLRDTILERRPDVLADFTQWFNDKLKSEIDRRYRLLEFNGVKLCVKKELAEELKDPSAGSCPAQMM